MFEDNINRAEQRINELVSYMRVKIELRDWHAVADAAMDIRELEASIDTLRTLDGKCTTSTAIGR